MRSSFVFALSLLFFNLYSNSQSPSVVDRTLNPTIDRAISDRAALLDPIQVEGLTLIPIVETRSSVTGDVLVLDEAMKSRLVRIEELPGGSVGELRFANAADHPVFVLAGEVILGGKQDRIIAANTLIPPHTTQTVPVFCVEKGRWAGDTDEFTTAGVLAHDRLRGRANYAGQGDVWSEVAIANSAHATTSATDTYRTLAIRQRETSASWEARVFAALQQLPTGDRARMIGYAVSYGESLVTVDMFASPALFAKLERKLVRAYIAEAVDLGAPVARPPCPHAVRDFMADADGARAEPAFATAASTTRIQRGSLVDSSRVHAGDRHLYSNYLGNSPADRRLPRTDHHDRHLYPSYIGNARPAYPNYLGVPPGTPRPHCNDRRLYASYVGNCEPAAPNPRPGRLRRTNE